MREIIVFLKSCFINRDLIKILFLREIKSRYAGTWGGIFWFFGQHILTMVMYLFVFVVGFRTPAMDGVPYAIILITGYIPWMLFVEVIHFSTISITQNPFLVTRTVFPVQVLVLVSLLIGMMTHAVLLLVLIVILYCSKIALSFWCLQILYYLFGLTLLSLGFGWLFAALNVISRDVAQIVSIIINIWFWATPVVWYTAMIPIQYRVILQLNPLYFIIEGYRKSLLSQTPFWTDGPGSLYFWLICVGVFFMGIKAFVKLQSEFAEVL